MSLMPHGHQSGLFINAPLRSVSDCLVQWGKELEDGTTAEYRNVPLSLAWSFVDNDRKVFDDRAFLIPIRNWTAYFDNNYREFISSSHPEVLCRRLRVDTCYFSYDDRTPGMEGSAQYGHVRYQKSEGSTKTRQVTVQHDGGWTFEEFGDPLPYEHLDKYKIRKKADRLNPELLRTYGQALGIPFWDESAYGREVIVLKWGRPPSKDPKAGFQRIVTAAKASGITGKLTWLRSVRGTNQTEK